MRQLRLVETRRGAPEMLRTEVGGHIAHRQPTFDAARVSQTEQMIEDGLRQEPRSRNSCALVLPCRFDKGAHPPHQQSHMAIAGSAQTQRIQQQQLARRIGEMTSPRNTCVTPMTESSTALQKKNAGRAVVAPNDEVADIARRVSLRPVHRVDELDDLIVRHRKAQRGPKTL